MSIRRILETSKVWSKNLSSFSGHVSKIKDIMEHANSKSLVLMDELGSGTDPMEGAAFAMSIIDY